MTTLSEAIARLEDRFKPGGTLFIHNDNFLAAREYINEVHECLKIIRQQQGMIKKATDILLYFEDYGIDETLNAISPDVELEK